MYLNFLYLYPRWRPQIWAEKCRSLYVQSNFGVRVCATEAWKYACLYLLVTLLYTSMESSSLTESLLIEKTNAYPPDAYWILNTVVRGLSLFYQTHLMYFLARPLQSTFFFLVSWKQNSSKHYGWEWNGPKQSNRKIWWCWWTKPVRGISTSNKSKLIDVNP